MVQKASRRLKPTGRSRPLPVIAGEIRHEVEQAEQHWQSAVQHAVRAGELLMEAKAQCIDSIEGSIKTLRHLLGGIR